ncbi:MAG: hypothetical protein LCH52_05440 [Bacteroidetes bacterium]|nr:hypothetical protein [Bacteroidota bacterium]
MTTENFSTPVIDGSSAQSFEIDDTGAVLADKMIAVVYTQGIALLSKKSSALNGSDTEIEVKDGTSYIMKFTVDDCQTMAAKGNLTYKLFKMTDGETTAMFGGTLASGTPTEAVIPVLGQKKSIYYKDAETTASLSDYENGDLLYDPSTNDLKLKDDNEWKTIFNGA